MSKPSFVPELKLRMDQFLSSTSVSTNPLPGLPVGAQTLGSAKEIAAHLQRVQDRERRGQWVPLPYLIRVLGFLSVGALLGSHGNPWWTGLIHLEM